MAIANYERTVNTGDSPYDRYLLGDDSALSAAALRGLDRFDALGCPECHGGLFFDLPTNADGSLGTASGFYNTGQYNVDGQGSYPPDDQGLFELTGEVQDIGRFRAPSLRNVAATPPYNQDATTATLSDLLTHYARGGRVVQSGQYPGDGALNPYKDPRITGFELTDGDRDDLLAFFDALTDEAALADPRYDNPWCADDDERPDCVPPIEPDL